MKQINVIAIFFVFIFLLCSPSTYQLHIGESYRSTISEHSFRVDSIYLATNPDSSLEITGVYCARKLFLDKYPVVRAFNKQSGFFSVPLTDSINCQTDVLLKIKGKIINLPQKYPMIKKTSYHKHLSVTSFKMISDLYSIKNIINKEYLRIRNNLQKKITPKGSKLRLTNEPEWIIWYNETEQKFIFTTHQYDLMYAADIEFIVNANTEKITDVFAREWFKGE